MKNPIQIPLMAMALLLTFFGLDVPDAHAQGTAFTYQGRLNDGGSPATGNYDLTFSLYYTNATGVAIAGPVTNSATVVSNGLFTTAIDFGSAVFNGTNCWLEIGVRTNGSATTFGILTPRQLLTPVPYAIYAESAGNLIGSIPANQVSGTLALAQLPATVVTNGASGVNFSGNLNLPALTASTGIIYAGGNLLMHGDSMDNFFAGPSAGNLTISGGNNSGIGSQALLSDTSGSQNTANGGLALYSNTGGAQNVADGFETLYSNTTGAGNTANGDYALFFNTTGSYNAANGFQALYHNTTAYFNTANGDDALYLNTIGYENTANGYQSLFLNTTGYENTAGGVQALYSNTTGIENTANGYQALYNNTYGGNNVANGYDALVQNISGSLNVANGSQALFDNISGNNNTANGFNALQSNTTGSGNTAEGSASLLSNTTGNNNTASGEGALYYNTNGTENTADGVEALQNLANGNDNIAVGYNAGVLNYSGSDNIYIGNPGQDEDNIIRIGDTQVQTYLTGEVMAGTIVASGDIYASGKVYSGGVQLTSDRNTKENFTAINVRALLEKVAALPVTKWNYKADSKSEQHIGPMAQDFQAAFGLDGNDDKHISVVDEGGVALAAIQGLNQKLDEKDTEIQGLKQTVDELKKMVQSLAEKK